MKQVAADCKYYKGDRPCHFHKQSGQECRCENYAPFEKHILIIKLGARGDVIRTTPLLHKIKEVYPQAKVYWVTDFPDCVPACVDEVLPFNARTTTYLQAARFDLVLNLDKEKEACALVSMLSATNKKGFTLGQHNTGCAGRCGCGPCVASWAE